MPVFWFLLWHSLNALLVVVGLFVVSRVVWPAYWYAILLAGAFLWILAMSKSGLVPIRYELLQLAPVRVLVFASHFLIFSAGMIISDLALDLKMSLNRSAIHWPSALVAGFLFAGAMLVVHRSPKVSGGQAKVV